MSEPFNIREQPPPSLENDSVCTSTPWPEAGKMSRNLFELRKDWPIPPTNNTASATNPKLPIKVEPQEQDQPTPCATAPKPEQCRWGPNCLICKNAEEDWDGEHQKQFQQTNTNIQTQDTQQKNSFQTQKHEAISGPEPSVCTRLSGTTKLPAHPDTVLRCSGQICELIHLRREWEEKMEKLNKKYGLHYFSDSELDSELDEGKNYRYEHKYETLILLIISYLNDFLDKKLYIDQPNYMQCNCT